MDDNGFGDQQNLKKKPFPISMIGMFCNLEWAAFTSPKLLEKPPKPHQRLAPAFSDKAGQSTRDYFLRMVLLLWRILNISRSVCVLYTHADQ